MSKTVWNRYFLGLALITSLLLLVWIASINAGAQTQKSGDWTASVSKDEAKIQLSLEERRNKNGSKHQHGSCFDFSELQGLTREQALSGGPVSFSLVREAGKIDFEGSFQNGKGFGTFRFTGNPAFVSAMKSRGFDFVVDDDEDRLFAAATINITTALADDLASAGFGKLNTDDLFKAAIFKIDSKFMREMKASGFNDLGLEELVKARIFKIDADVVRKAKADGANITVESLVERKIGVARR